MSHSFMLSWISFEFAATLAYSEFPISFKRQHSSPAQQNTLSKRPFSGGVSSNTLRSSKRGADWIFYFLVKSIVQFVAPAGLIGMLIVVPDGAASNRSAYSRKCKSLKAG